MRTYFDFIVWTNEDLQVERIYPDEEFWVACVSQSQCRIKNNQHNMSRVCMNMSLVKVLDLIL